MYSKHETVCDCKRYHMSRKIFMLYYILKFILGKGMPMLIHIWEKKKKKRICMGGRRQLDNIDS